MSKMCVDCEEEIEVGRAKALPNTETCIHCQRKREQDGRVPRPMMRTHTTFACGGEIEEIRDEIVMAK